MSEDILKAQRQHLADLLVAIQRCAWFLHCSEQKLSWPLDGEALSTRKKDVDLFETLAALCGPVVSATTTTLRWRDLEPV